MPSLTTDDYHGIRIQSILLGKITFIWEILMHYSLFPHRMTPSDLTWTITCH